MTIARMAAVAGLLLAPVLALGACGTVNAGRDRVVRAPAACADQTVQIYFEAESAELTGESHAVIAAAARGARACKVTGIDVIGLADATGAADVSLELSKRRAKTVTHALGQAGLPEDKLTMVAAGQTGAVTPAGQARPLRRRADVVLHLSAK